MEEQPKSPESLATRDFSVSCLSSRTGDWESRFEDTQVDEVESSLREALSLNYEVGTLIRTASNYLIKVKTIMQLLFLTSCLFLICAVQEARALLGRLEYQRGNYDAALQVFQGIEIRGLSSRMTRAIFERLQRQTKPSKKAMNGIPTSVMSMHSVSLLLEAILLKAKSLEELTRYTGTSFFTSEKYQ